MKVNRSPDVCRKLPLMRSAAVTAIDLFASVTFAVAVILPIAAACAFGTEQNFSIQWTARRLQADIPAIVGTVQTLMPEVEAPPTENTFHIEALRYARDFVITPWLSAGKAAE